MLLNVPDWCHVEVSSQVKQENLIPKSNASKCPLNMPEVIAVLLFNDSIYAMVQRICSTILSQFKIKLKCLTKGL